MAKKVVRVLGKKIDLSDVDYIDKIRDSKKNLFGIEICFQNEHSTHVWSEFEEIRDENYEKLSSLLNDYYMEEE